MKIFQLNNLYKNKHTKEGVKKYVRIFQKYIK